MASLAALTRQHKAVVFMGILLLVLLVVSAVFGSRGWFHLRRLEREQAEVEALAVRLERQNERVEEHIRRVEGDDAYLEKVVRERIRWVKPNEVLYRADGGGAEGAGAEESGAPAPGGGD